MYSDLQSFWVQLIKVFQLYRCVLIESQDFGSIWDPSHYCCGINIIWVKLCPFHNSFITDACRTTDHLFEMHLVKHYYHLIVEFTIFATFFYHSLNSIHKESKNIFEFWLYKHRTLFDQLIKKRLQIYISNTRYNCAPQYLSISVLNTAIINISNKQNISFYFLLLTLVGLSQSNLICSYIPFSKFWIHWRFYQRSYDFFTISVSNSWRFEKFFPNSIDIIYSAQITKMPFCQKIVLPLIYFYLYSLTESAKSTLFTVNIWV